VLNWERPSNNKPCSARAYQLNSLVIAAGGDQAAIAPEGGPKYRLVGAGASLARPRRPGRLAERSRPRGECHFARELSNIKSAGFREQPIAATRAHEGPRAGDLAPLAASDGASLARSTMLSVSANSMTKVVLSVSQYASRTSASASLVKPVVWVDFGQPISLLPMCSPVAFSGEHTCSQYIDYIGAPVRIKLRTSMYLRFKYKFKPFVGGFSQPATPRSANSWRLQTIPISGSR
jgi:hypothetical protein